MKNNNYHDVSAQNLTTALRENMITFEEYLFKFRQLNETEETPIKERLQIKIVNKEAVNFKQHYDQKMSNLYFLYRLKQLYPFIALFVLILFSMIMTACAPSSSDTAKTVAFVDDQIETPINDDDNNETPVVENPEIPSNPTPPVVPTNPSAPQPLLS